MVSSQFEFKDISKSQVVLLKENEFVFRQGELPQGLYWIKSGCVKIMTHRALTRGRMSSPDYVQRLVGSGQFFGYSAVIQGQARASFAKTLMPTELHVFPIESVNTLMGHEDSLVKLLLVQAAKDLEEQSVVEQLHYLASVQERIAYQLIRLTDQFGVVTPRGVSLNLRLTRNELAQLAGTINESLSRHLTELKSEGIIELDGKAIVILDRQALMQKSGNFRF